MSTRLTLQLKQLNYSDNNVIYERKKASIKIELFRTAVYKRWIARKRFIRLVWESERDKTQVENIQNRKMIRQLIIVLFASYLVCMAANQTGKIGAILDKICAKRAAVAASARIEKDKLDKNMAPEQAGDHEEDPEDETEEPVEEKKVPQDMNSNSNQNSNRKMYYGIDRRFFGDDSSESSDESGNVNANTNLNVNGKHRNRPKFIVHPRRSVYEEPNRENRRRMMNGMKRKTTRY